MLRLAAIFLIAWTAVVAQEPATFKIARDGFDLYYRPYGTGTPVTILAGGIGFDCDYLEPVARELAKARRAVLIELRGTGRSAPSAINRDTINLAQFLGDLEAVRVHLNIERWSLLGHSAGAALAMAYAARTQTGWSRWC
jgi:proline iminopeptidase